MTTLTLLSTFALRGDLDLLPRLHTFLRALRAGAEDVLWVDLGESCAADIWPCGLTEGRSTLLALDAMGCSAANTEGVLSPDGRDKLAEQVALALVDAAHAHTRGGVHLTGDPESAGAAPADAPLTVIVRPAAATALTGRVLALGSVRKGEVGRAVVAWSAGSPPALVEAAVLPLPPHTAPETSIAGVIDYIRDEARYFEQRRGSAPPSDSTPPPRL